MPQRYRMRERVHEELIPDLLASRGVVGEQEAMCFLQPDFERDSHDPFLLPDMAAAVERILFAINHDELVAVWSDYDCDGVPGGVLLVEFLQSLGARVVHHIPDRHADGFGLNVAGIVALAEQGVRLIITVDCGTTDVAQAQFAREKDIDLIITDHHLPLVSEKSFSPAAGRRGDASENNFSSTQQLLPPAFAVVNPHRADSRYPFTELCGAGVAWKLVQAMLLKNRFDIAEGKEKWFLDLVGIATLADMVPLVGENRMLASFGLQVLRKTRREGLRAMLKLLRLSPAALTEEDVTFMLAPRINAASRLEKAQTAARFLSSTLSAAEGGDIALKLNRINDERKGLVAAAMKHAHKELRARDDTQEQIIVIGSVDWRPGILGLVAQKLVEQEHKTVFVWGRGEGSAIKGSCRSGDGTNIVDIMRGAADLFDDFGGHDFAGGFSLGEGRVHQLHSRLAAAHAALPKKQEKEKEIVVDRDLELAEASHAHAKIQRLAPFGAGNAKPLFLFPTVTIANVRVFGKGGDHLEFALARGQEKISGISFFSTPDSFQKKISTGMSADVIAHLELDWRARPRLRVVDVI